MNLDGMEEDLWQYLGLDAGARPDWRRQQIRNGLNRSMDEIAQATVALSRLQRESSIALVIGQSDYVLDDWLRRPLVYWPEGADASRGRVHAVRPIPAARDGWRAGERGTVGDYDFTTLPKTTAAMLSLAGPAVVSDGDTTLTWAAPRFSAAAQIQVIGRMLRLNSEDADYQISQATDSVLTLDRPIVSVLKGNGFSGEGKGYVSPLVEISPPGRLVLRFMPTPTETATIYYRGVWIPRRLINPTDVPALDSDCHQVLWKGALRFLSNLDRSSDDYQRNTGEYAQALQAMVARENDEQVACNRQRPRIGSMSGGYFDPEKATGPAGATGGAVWQ